jgi:hypothetical protein
MTEMMRLEDRAPHREDLVSVLETQQAPGYRIPRQPTMFSLDMARIRRIIDSTEQAAALLATVFNARNEHANG